MGWGGRVDLYGLVGSGVVGGAGGHAEEVLVCHALGKGGGLGKIGQLCAYQQIHSTVMLQVGCGVVSSIVPKSRSISILRKSLMLQCSSGSKMD